MNRMLKNQKGFTFTEVMVVAVIFLFVISTILSAWLFTYRSWSVEGKRTNLRIDLMKALETVQSDIRLSSATYMSFYPATGGVYTAVSMPLAEVDASGFLTLDANGDIQWDKTVVYHIFTELDGSKTLRRTVFDPRDNTLDHDERFAQLSNVITNGEGSGSYTTDKEFLEDLETFDITPLPIVVDFYENDSDPVRVGKVTFGWIRLDSGDHTIRFEVSGQNASSSGYGFGLDYIRLEPCGSRREVEYYDSSFAPSGALDSSGDTITRVHDNTWSNENFLEYDASAVGDYLEITDYYDLWRESAFDNVNMNNAMEYGEEVRVKLELPQDRETGKENISWYAYAEAGYTVQEGTDANLPTYPITIRTIVTNSFIDSEADLVRVKFKSSSENPLKITAAYITRRNSDEDGLANQSTGGLDIEEYHRHQQLFFQDVHDGDNDSDTDEILAAGWVPVDSELWSEWIAFPLVKNVGGTDYDYFITICIPNLDTAVFPSAWDSYDPFDTNCKYWIGASTHSYYVTGDYTTVVLPAAGTTDWSGYTVNASNNIYVTAEIDTWRKQGSVESDILDTGIDDPSYNEVKWSEDNPSGTEVLMKARSADDQFMDTATDWSAIAGSTGNPAGLAIGSGRYVQFYAELSTEPFWTASGSNLSYADYVDTQVGLGADRLFPASGGEYYVTGLYSTWIDDVEIDWPGDDRMCVLSGYIARKDDYGQTKITVDGRDLIKVLNIDMSVTVEYEDKTIRQENNMEVEPRNTGR